MTNRMPTPIRASSASKALHATRRSKPSLRCLLPALAARDVHAALAATTAPIVAVMNLGPQVPETLGLDVADHLRAVLDTGVRVDRIVVDPHSRIAVDPDAIAALGVACTLADVARPDVMAHAPAKLASVLAALLQS